MYIKNFLILAMIGKANIYISYLFAAELSRLDQEVAKSKRAAFAEGTCKNLTTQWRSYLLFCEHFGIEPLPTTTNTLIRFAQFLSRSFKSTASISNYLSGVKTMHLYLDLVCPDLSCYEIKLVLKGLARSNPHTPHQAQPITPSMLLEFHGYLLMDSAFDCSFWCLCLFAFFLMARKSNLVPMANKALIDKNILRRGQVEVCVSHLTVTVNWSKTIQFGERQLFIPLCAIKDSIFCPVSAYNLMCSLIPGDENTPVFVHYNRAGRLIPISYELFQTKLRKLVAQTGEDPSLYSSHSLRRGGASWAFSSKVPVDLIQSHGDWSSDCYKKYLQFSFKDKLSVSEQMRDAMLINS